MSQAYSAAFAKIYNQRWIRFAQQAGPLIREFYGSLPVARNHRTLLDLCCGTGQLARHFLENGYEVSGIDLSADMLAWARENNLPFLTAGQAHFYQADAAKFSLEKSVGLVISTFDALNHLPDLTALRSCFACVIKSLVDNGVFIFDLNTRLGLKEGWMGVNVEDTQDLFLLTRAVWVEADQRAYTRITGFSRQADGNYERFEETAFNSAFDIQEVQSALLETGFRSAYTAKLVNLDLPVEKPENESRIFFVVRR
jgi:SAM-dependent methyltransferase